MPAVLEPTAPAAATRGAARVRERAELVGVLAWVFTVAVVGNTVPWPTGRWPMTGWQVGLYALQAVPVLLLRPRLLRSFRGPARGLLPALGLAVATTVAAAVVGSVGATLAVLVRLTATATVEELVFRGWLWQLVDGEHGRSPRRRSPPSSSRSTTCRPWPPRRTVRWSGPRPGCCPCWRSAWSSRCCGLSPAGWPYPPPCTSPSTSCRSASEQLGNR